MGRFDVARAECGALGEIKRKRLKVKRRGGLLNPPVGVSGFSGFSTVG